MSAWLAEEARDDFLSLLPTRDPQTPATDDPGAITGTGIMGSEDGSHAVQGADPVRFDSVELREIRDGKAEVWEWNPDAIEPLDPDDPIASLQQNAESAGEQFDRAAREHLGEAYDRAVNPQDAEQKPNGRQW